MTEKQAPLEHTDTLATTDVKSEKERKKEEKKEEKSLEEGLEESMDASDPPAAIQP